MVVGGGPCRGPYRQLSRAVGLLPSGRSRKAGSRCLNVPTSKILASFEPDTGALRPFELDEATRACCAPEPPSLSRRRHSRCYAPSRGNQARSFTTNALLDQVWGHQFVTDSVLRTAISELRTALDDDARKRASSRP